MAASKLLIYGARSGIQKAVRRGDPALARTCFEIIWEEKEHRQWLMWRLPVLVFEDCWIMAGELAKAREANALLQGEELKTAWLKFILQLAIARKNQDAAWLWYLARHGQKSYRQPEFMLMRDIVASVPNGQPGKLSAVILEEKLREGAGRELYDYEKRACRVVESRRSGGMVSDQWNAISAQVLIHLRGLPEERVVRMLEEQKRSFAGTSLKMLESLPWFCFDMHTRPGMLAMRVWLKNHKTSLIDDEEKLGTVWFQLTSAAQGPKVLPVTRSCTTEAHGAGAPSWDECLWEREKLDSIAEWLGVTAPVMANHWERQCLPKVKELVEWAIRKSEE